MAIPTGKFINRLNQKRMASWKNVAAIYLKPQAGADITKVVFAQFKWVVSENPTTKKNDAAK